MSEIITGKDEMFAIWAAAKIDQVGTPENFGKYVAVGVATGKSRDDKLQAVVVFHEAYPRWGHCQVSVAAEDPRWVSKRNIRAILAIPFLQYGCHTVRATTLHTNERVIRLAKALGFIREATLSDYFGKGRHAAVFRMSASYYEKAYWPHKVDKEVA